MKFVQDQKQGEKGNDKSAARATARVAYYTKGKAAAANQQLLTLM